LGWLLVDLDDGNAGRGPLDGFTPVEGGCLALVHLEPAAQEFSWRQWSPLSVLNIIAGWFPGRFGDQLGTAATGDWSIVNRDLERARDSVCSIAPGIGDGDRYSD
jgi:hypothetical protein